MSRKKSNLLSKKIFRKRWQLNDYHHYHHQHIMTTMNGDLWSCMSLSTTHPCWWLPWLLGVPSTLPVVGCHHLARVIIMLLLMMMMVLAS